MAGNGWAYYCCFVYSHTHVCCFVLFLAFLGSLTESLKHRRSIVELEKDFQQISESMCSSKSATPREIANKSFTEDNRLSVASAVAASQQILNKNRVTISDKFDLKLVCPHGIFDIIYSYEYSILF